MRAYLLCSFVLVGCGGARPPESTAMNHSEEGHELAGPISLAQLVEAEPSFAPRAGVSFDEEAVTELRNSTTRAEIEVYLGTWCGDSRREVSRFFSLIDHLEGRVPFEVRLIAVDRLKSAPDLREGLDLAFVPTFVLMRDGRELGRIVEVPPGSIERGLAELLSGRATGTISATR